MMNVQTPFNLQAFHALISKHQLQELLFVQYFVS